MVSHRLSSIHIQSYKTLYRRRFHIGCHVNRYNLIRYTDNVSHRLSSIQIKNIRLYTEDGFT